MWNQLLNIVVERLHLLQWRSPTWRATTWETLKRQQTIGPSTTTGRYQCTNPKSSANESQLNTSTQRRRWRQENLATMEFVLQRGEVRWQPHLQDWFGRQQYRSRNDRNSETRTFICFAARNEHIKMLEAQPPKGFVASEKKLRAYRVRARAKIK